MREVQKKNYNKSMRYDFEYFYIYHGKLLLSESIEVMEELLDLAAIEKYQAQESLNKKRNYSDNSSTAFSASR